MRKTSLLAGLVLLLAAGCGKKDFDERLPLQLPPLPDGEISRYEIGTPAGPIGRMVTGVTIDWYGEIPVFILDLVSRTMTGDVESVDSSIIVMRQHDLRPISAFRFIKTGAALVTTAANYGDNSIAVSTWLHTGQDEQRLLPMTAKTYDTDQLTFVGRALRLDPKRPAKIAVAEPIGPPFGGGIRPGEFRGLGDETVTVPAGSFSCRKVGLTVGDNEVELWYEKAGTGRLVRYFSTGSGITLELLPSAALELVPRED
ncbi:MAG: hypothetical protein R6X14_04515 [bacterium]